MSNQELTQIEQLRQDIGVLADNALIATTLRMNAQAFDEEFRDAWNRLVEFAPPGIHRCWFQAAR